MARERLSAAAARRIALGAQGFGRPRPSGRIDRRHIRGLFDRIGLLQVDSVNVLTRSEELPVFARLGPHARDLVRTMESDGELFEYWAHEASLLPVETEPLLRHRQRTFDEGPWRTVAELKRSNPGLIDDVLAEVRERGPLRAGELTGATRKTEKWWGWTDHKRVVEYLFATGVVLARRDPKNFERLYEVRESILPAHVLAAPTPNDHDARVELLRRSARSHGVGTMRDLADYYRLNIPASRAAMAELVESGELLAVEVEGWTQPGYLHVEAVTPRRIDAHAFLSPFDPVVWERARTERLFDFHYRIEIYTPAPKRVHGYYVLPFLLGDELVGRVDLKADRAASALLVQSAWVEPGHDPDRVSRAMAEELRAMATWLTLDTVTVARRGTLGPAVARHFTASKRTNR